MKKQAPVFVLRVLAALTILVLVASTQVVSTAASPLPGPVASEGGGVCNLPYDAGSHTLTIQSGGMSRVVILYVPSSYTGKTRVPMVLNLHGSQADAAIQMSISDLPAAAEKYGFIAVAPQGIVPAPPGFRWNVPGVTLPPGVPPDDEAFLADTISYLQGTLCIDAKRVFGTGYSGGGRMISQFACDHADQIAAIAPVVGLRAGFPITGQDYPQPGTCAPSRPVSVRTFAGTADPVNPYLGGGAPYWQYGAEAALKAWAQINSCNQPERFEQVTANVTLEYYAACNENAVVQMYLAKDAGHTWPGSQFSIGFYNGALGPVNMEISATDLMWQFFELHHLPGSPE